MLIPNLAVVCQYRVTHRPLPESGFNSILLQAEDNYVSLFRLHRSASPQNIRSLEATGFFDDDVFASLPERWHLQNLCVSARLSTSTLRSTPSWLRRT